MANFELKPPLQGIEAGGFGRAWGRAEVRVRR